MTKSSILPSKNFLITLGVLMVILIIATVAPRIISSQKDKKLTNRGVTSVDVTVGDFVGRDTDGDGVEDWEELLWGLDPTNRDSDGNGVPDGQELVLLRQQISSVNTVDADEENLSESDMVARQLYTALALIDSQGELTDDKKDELSFSLEQEILTPLIEVPTTAGDLKTVPATPENIQKYADEMTTLLSESVITDELLINILQAIETEGDTTIYQSKALRMQEIYAHVLNMEIPTNAALNHAEFANAVGELTFALTHLTNPEADPILMFRSVSQLDPIMNKFVLIFSSLQTYFNQNLR